MKMAIYDHKITVGEKKYTFIHYKGNWRVHCLRYEEPWMIYEKGSNAISAMMYDYEQLEAENKRLIKIEFEARKLMESFVEIAKYQNDLLGHGLKEACENWDEATSVSFDITGLKEALEGE